MTAEEAGQTLATYSPDDLAYALKYAAADDVDPAWRAALMEAQARERAAARKARDPRRARPS
jgi:hypothetical protein